MHGGVILFRSTGADARRYVEADRSRADDYYLGADASVAAFTALDSAGNVTAALGLDPEAYAAWVDWVNPVTGESMGTPRLPGVGKQGSPRFAEMVVNAPKSLSIAAALHSEVSDVLDRAQQDAVAEIQAWLAEHSVTRVGPRGKQEVVPVQQLQTVAVSHRTSRAGDPHRHIHFQVGTRVWAAGKWRALDTAALFRQQGAIRALGTAVIAAHPELAEVLDRHGLTLDPVSGEVVELERFNGVMSKRGEQVRKHLERFEAEWEAAHPGETVGPVVSARLAAKAWAHERPGKKPTTLREEQAWATELREAGYDPETLRRRGAWTPARGLDAGQERAAAAVASRDPLVVVEGAAGAGKTTMLGVAIEVAAQHGRVSRVVAPTLRAAQVAQARQDGEAITVSTNDEARTVNARIREERVSHGVVDDARTVYGNDGLPIGAGDVIQTRKNNTDVGVANRQQWVVQHVEAMGRDRADRGLADATRRAVEEVAGLTENGPVRFVNDEMAALVKRAETAEAQAARWQQVSAALASLSDREVEVRERARAAEQTARERAEQVRAEVAAPVVSAARRALTEWKQAEATEHTAGEQVRASSWFGKRRARDEHENAQARTAEARQQVTSEWGEPPRWNERADAWVERVTRPRIDSDPRVIDAEQEHRAARDALLHRPERAQTERLVAFARVFGAETVIRNQQAYLTTNPMQQATRAAKTAKQAREEAELLRSLTPAEATERIEQTRAAQAEREAQRAERERAMSHDYEEQHRSARRRDGPTLGL